MPLCFVRRKLLAGDVLRVTFYSVYIPHLIRYARVSSQVTLIIEILLNFLGRVIIILNYLNYFLTFIVVSLN